VIRSLAVVIVLAGATLGCCAQTPTLADQLDRAGIPNAGFSGAELAQAVNAVQARYGDQIYLAYMRVDANDMFSGFPQLIRFDPAIKKAQRSELAIGEEDQCCGSPLAIQFTRNYVALIFHSTPSASTTIVVNNALKPVEILFGIDLLEIAPDQVVFIENMIHFAPAHPERLRFLDLRTGENQALYPPKGDAMRTEFARQHKQHMPPQRVCQELNDPCDPDFYDEDIQFLGAETPGRFTFRVDRNVVHAMAKDREPDSVLSESALYVYERRNRQWLYCEMEFSGKTDRLIGCDPKLPALPDGKEMYPGPFVKRMN